MLIIGVICLVLGFIFGIQILWIIGIVLAVIGAILLVAALVGGADRKIGGRRYWY
jgi:hypothetical protein